VIPSAEAQLAWIDAVLDFGVRRPGSPQDQAVADWCEARFRELGLADVRQEPVPLPHWRSEHATLTAWPADDPPAAISLPGFALPHTLAADGVEAAVVRFTPGDDATGAIAVEPLVLSELPQSYMAHVATSAHDPDGEFAELVQVLPFSPRFQEVAEPAMAAGAVGWVGVFQGPWETCDYYVPYDGVVRDVHALWLSRSSGAELDRLLDGGPVTGRLDVDARRDEVVAHNVVGTLPGASDEWVVIASHHDAPWASAVEDGSGIAMVLAQVAHWVDVPADERPHNLLFLLTTGHMTHGAGTAAFIRDHADLLDDVVLEVHLEHTANEVVGDGRGGLVPTGEPEVRWWFTTQEPGLEQAVQAALEAEDLRRSLVLPPEVFGPSPTTDGGFFHLEGVPLVNFLTAPMYLFDSADTVDKVHVDSLEPVGRATVRIVESLRGRTAADLRRIRPG
jgi:hypothetical protein